jgi:hypothetical protein
VLAFVTHSDPAASINGLMQKRAFQTYDHTLDALPARGDDLLEPIPPTPPAAPPATTTPAPAATPQS